MINSRAMRTMPQTPPTKPWPVFYPESDGAPVGETGWHVEWFVRLQELLRQRYRARTDVYVGGNMFIYFAEGDPRDVVCPDAFVAFGTRSDQRRTWKTWEEGGLFPQVVFELVFEDSKSRDLISKRGLYEVLGVQNYLVYDPTGEVLEGPRLRGWSRQGGVLVPMEPEPGAAIRRIRADALEVWVEEHPEGLRLVDTKTGERLLFADELADARQQAASLLERAESLLEAERAGKKSAEADNQRLLAEIDRLKDRAKGSG